MSTKKRILAANVLKTLLNFSMSLTETLSDSITFNVINEFGKGAVVEIEIVFWRIYHVACQVVHGNGTF